MKLQSLSPECSLLLACARTYVAHSPTHPLARSELNWPAFIALAHDHGMSTLAADALYAAAANLPDARVNDAVRLHAADCTRHALQQTHELLRIGEALRTRGIDALTYKGPVLAQAAYGNVALRDCVDLDLLVEPERLEDASRVLEECGYAAGYSFTAAQRAAFTRTDGDYPLRGPNDVLVELHCRVSSERFGVNLRSADLLRSGIEVDILGSPVRTLAPRDHALVLCVHGCKHGWPRLEWLVALTSLVRVCNLDPAELLERASLVHARRNVLLSFALAAELLDVALPHALERALTEDVKLQGLVKRSQDQLVSGTTSTTASRLLFNMQAKDGLRDQLKFAYRWLALPTPEDWKAVRISDRFAPLYGVLRPIRLAVRTLRGRITT